MPPSDDIEFGENLALVMMRTSNNYEMCMKMPVVELLQIIKEIRKDDLMQNKEWQEAYFKQIAFERINKNKALAQTKTDVSGLKSLARIL